MIYRSCIARIVLLLCVGVCVHAEDYYLDSQTGDDRNDGLSPANAWATLTKASAGSYQAGDRILLKRGVPFKGKLSLRHIIAGSDQPLVVDAYGKGEQLPKIDSAGYIGGITIEDCSYVKVRNIEISSDGGVAVDSKAKTDRYGIYVSKSNNISIENLNIHAIFATEQTKSEGKDNTTAYGHGARIEDSERVQVRACRIERVGRYGINALRSDDLLILNNQTDHTGCSGLQMSRCKGVEVRGNIFDHPGSFIDERMHGRGSGSWVWSCEDVRYESNHFLNAKGKGDSCGVHIDFNCRNVVVERCFSMNNEGGFIEILGNNHNCAYRYNISVNDGFRRKGKDGAHQEGKVFWLSGYQGRKKPPSGPFNSYIYNNTIYVKADALARFSVSPTARGALVANNIFHILGPTEQVAGDQKRYGKIDSKASDIIFTNNVYIRDGIIPANLQIRDEMAIIGNVGFTNPGGQQPSDYIPTNAELVKDMGITITKISGDDTGLVGGLKVEKDFFGNPIVGKPDIGAIELQ